MLELGHGSVGWAPFQSDTVKTSECVTLHRAEKVYGLVLDAAKATTTALLLTASPWGPWLSICTADHVAVSSPGIAVGTVAKGRDRDLQLPILPTGSGEDNKQL